MHLSVAAADKRANSSFSHTKPERFSVIFCILLEFRRSVFAELFLGFLCDARVGQLEYSSKLNILRVFDSYSRKKRCHLGIWEIITF